MQKREKALEALQLSHKHIAACTLEEYSHYFASTAYMASNGAYGSPGLLRNAFDDARWQGIIISVRSSAGEVYLPVFLAFTAQIKSTQFVRSFEEAGYLPDTWGEKVALIGGVPGGLPGFLYRTGAATNEIAALLVRAVEAAAAWSFEQGAPMLARFSDAQLATACEQLSHRTIIQPGDLKAVLEVKKPSDYPKRVRGVYAADLRHFTRLGLSWHALPWQEVLAEIGELIVALRRRHGSDEVVRRLQEEMLDLEDGGGVEILGIVVYNGNKQLVGGSLIWMYRDLLQVVEVGMVDNPTYSRETYFAAGFHAPLEIANERGKTSIDFGLSATTPKRVRGATLEPSYLIMVEP